MVSAAFSVVVSGLTVVSSLFFVVTPITSVDKAVSFGSAKQTTVKLNINTKIKSKDVIFLNML